MQIVSADPIDLSIAQLPGSIVLIRYEDGFVETHSEYKIYSELDVLTATGGALGMFLGWSVYQNYTIIMDLIQKIVGAVCKRNRKGNNTT